MRPAVSRSCATPSAATTRSRSPAPRKYYEDMGYPGHANCTENFNAPARPATASPPRRAGRRSTSSTTPAFDAGPRAACPTSPGRGPATTSCCGRSTDLVCASSACPDDIDPANGWDPTDVHVRVYPRGEPLLDGDGPPHDPRRRARAHPGDRVPSPHFGADAQLRRVPRLLAADLLPRPGRDRRVLGLPRGGGGHGPVAAAQVRGPRPRRRGAPAARDHPRRAQALRRPGRLHRRSATRRAGMLDDATIFRLGADKLPVRRRRRVRRRAAREQAERLRPARLGQVLDRPAAQPRRPGAEEPRDPQVARLDAADPPHARGAEVVPLHRSAASATPTGSRILVSRTGYTGELGYEVWCHPKDALAVWDAIWEAGEPQGWPPWASRRSTSFGSRRA